MVLARVQNLKERDTQTFRESWIMIIFLRKRKERERKINIQMATFTDNSSVFRQAGVLLKSLVRGLLSHPFFYRQSSEWAARKYFSFDCASVALLHLWTSMLPVFINDFRREKLSLDSWACHDYHDLPIERGLIPLIELVTAWKLWPKRIDGNRELFCPPEQIQRKTVK